jgi:predicted RNA-binding protein associated with RNAse of E/G family
MVVDLDDLATAIDLGLATPAETSLILRQTQAAVHAINRGEFPFPEIARGRVACRALGWEQPTTPPSPAS